MIGFFQANIRFGDASKNYKARFNRKLFSNKNNELVEDNMVLAIYRAILVISGLIHF